MLSAFVFADVATNEKRGNATPFKFIKSCTLFNSSLYYLTILKAAVNIYLFDTHINFC